MKESKVENFAQTCHYWNGEIGKLLGRHWSRKFNGFCVVWDGGLTRGMKADDVPWYKRGGDKKEMISTGLWTLGRASGPKVVHAPKSWLDKLPIGVPIQGELWKDDDLEYIKTHCKRHSVKPIYWNGVKILAFGIKPYETFDGIEEFDLEKDLFYENRPTKQLLHLAKDYGPSPTKVWEWVEMTKINSKQQALDLISSFETLPWEGIMFADLTAKYENKRSYNVLKHKPSFEDEAIMTGIEMGKTGSRVGTIGAYIADYTITEKCQYICGFKKSFIGKTVQIRISGLNGDEWELDNPAFIKGQHIPFSYKMFSVHGVPQSSNLYRGM